MNSRPRRNMRGASTIPQYKYVKKALEQISTVHDPVVLTKIQDMNLHADLKANIIRRGFITPTMIQEQTIPHILEGKDVVGIANTGTGKTGAFVIPLLDRIVNKLTSKVLIIVPTRELAQQIQREIHDFAQSAIFVKTAVSIGGGSMQYQMRQLQRDPQFVIGTPGRLKDFVERRVINMKNFDTVVLDEVDRMVDMGFIQDITHLLSLMPEKRHSLFFSATIAPAVGKTIERFATEPVTVSVSTHQTSDMVEQDIVKIPSGSTKLAVLESLLVKEEMAKVLVFARTKRGAEHLSNTLYDKNFKVSCIHGDKPQRKREQAIRLFQENHIDVLIATDVAARGLDIDDITHVINFDEPATYDDYVHRIGRTGRANKKGYALTFVQ
ncbi:DEAD/DEAH box helicase [Candidatus Woesebacteria bacterium]|nr:DEAD/DEAH box helicase [Candidatus Woesebacteria bacterium]